MTHHSYISSFRNITPFIIGVLTILLCVGLVNTIIDKKGVYFGNKVAQFYYLKYAKNLIQSKIPIPAKENERLIKYYLADLSDSPNYLIGSSRSILINHDDIKEQRLINLSVSGATFEDFLLLLGKLLEKKNLPKKIYLEFDPWFFSKDAGFKFLEVFDFYEASLAQFDFIYEPSHRNLLEEKAMHIFNKNYFIYNLSSLWAKKAQSDSLLWSDQSYNADGTLNYSKAYEDNAASISTSTKELKFKYALDFIKIDPSIVEKFRETIRLCKMKGIQVVFIVLPYHPSINKDQYTSIKSKLITFYNGLKQISKDLQVSLYGNILPDEYHLKNEDFYDGIHLKKSGISKTLHFS